jgi:hypothetical protein
LMRENQKWFLISWMPPGPQPRRFSGFTCTAAGKETK